jgi:hypothetical protein
MDPSNHERESRYQQQAIDAEINSLEESIHALRCRNGPAPFSSLPTEIIAAIFLLVRSSGRPDIRLAHVCRRWREIALDHPLLWSRLDFTTVTPAGATEILARARMAPLYLDAKVPVSLWDNARFVSFQKELQTHVSHICQLRISAQPYYLNRTLKGLISPAPTLEKLSISDVRTFFSRRLSQVSVPDTLFDATTPKLSSLELCNCVISWSTPLLKGLKYLKITLSNSARPSLADWLDALEEMPQLQRLVLDSASPSVSSFPFHVERTVTLPSLVRLDISASALDCGLALAHLVLPALTSLCVTAKSVPTRPTIDDVQKMLPNVVQHAQGPQDSDSLQSVSIQGGRTRVAILACPTPTIDDSEWDAELSERVVLSVTTGRYHTVLDDHTRILDAALVALPLDNLVILNSLHNIRLDEQFWRRHVSRWPLLRHVRLAPLPARGFRETLLQDNGGRECPPFPSLTRLELTGSALSARRTILLCDTLMKRVEQGVPLEVLDVRTCAVTGLAIRLLSEIVVDVWAPGGFETTGTERLMHLTWDGARGPFVSDDDSGVEFYSEDFISVV